MWHLYQLNWLKIRNFSARHPLPLVTSHVKLFHLWCLFLTTRNTVLKTQLDKFLYSCLLIFFSGSGAQAVVTCCHFEKAQFFLCILCRNHVKPQPRVDSETLSGAGSPQPPCTPNSDTTASTLTPLSEPPTSPRENHHSDFSSRARSVKTSHVTRDLYSFSFLEYNSTCELHKSP